MKHKSKIKILIKNYFLKVFGCLKNWFLALLELKYPPLVRPKHGLKKTFFLERFIRSSLLVQNEILLEFSRAVTICHHLFNFWSNLSFLMRGIKNVFHLFSIHWTKCSVAREAMLVLLVTLSGIIRVKIMS